MREERSKKEPENNQFRHSPQFRTAFDFYSPQNCPQCSPPRCPGPGHRVSIEQCVPFVCLPWRTKLERGASESPTRLHGWTRGVETERRIRRCDWPSTLEPCTFIPGLKLEEGQELCDCTRALVLLAVAHWERMAHGSSVMTPSHPQRVWPGSVAELSFQRFQCDFERTQGTGVTGRRYGVSFGVDGTKWRWGGNECWIARGFGACVDDYFALSRRQRTPRRLWMSARRWSPRSAYIVAPGLEECHSIVLSHFSRSLPGLRHYLFSVAK